jgi:hypothetical protein
MGDIYLDTGFTTTRRPRMVRQEIVQIMIHHNVSDKPLMTRGKTTASPFSIPQGSKTGKAAWTPCSGHGFRQLV